MEQAVLNIWKSYNGSLEQFICRKVNHEDHCNDILQEVFIKVVRNIDKIGKVENPRSYLLKIADNAVTDHYRSKVNSPLTDEFIKYDQNIYEPTIKSISLQLADCCLRPMIEQLEPIYRDALIKTQLEGVSQVQLAKDLGISFSGAKSRVQRAKEKLKEIIQACCTYEFDKFGNIISC